MTTQKGMNEDTARLMQAIAALSSAPEVISIQGRLLDPTNTTRTRLLDLLLAEIDETVLRRILEFRNEVGDLLKVEVAERRVMRIVEDAEQNKDDLAREGGKILTSKDAPSTINTLQSYCSNSTAIHVVSRIPTQLQEHDFGGISCAEMLKSQQAIPNVTNFPKPIQIAINELVPHCIAIFANSDTVEDPLLWGQQQNIDALKQIAILENWSEQACDFQLWAGYGDDAQQIGFFSLSDATVWFVRNGEDWQFCHGLYSRIAEKLGQHSAEP